MAAFAVKAETQLRDQIATLGASIFERGLTFGSSGNISVRVDDGFLMTPTGSRLGEIDPARISKLTADGEWVGGDKPTKETFMHMAMYESRPNANAIVHLHSTYSVACSCLADIDPLNVLPPITAYYVMRVGKLPLIPYYRPGDKALGDAIREVAQEHHAVLLANHGPVVGGKDLATAGNIIEELEETARLYLLLHQHSIRPLTQEQIDDLQAHFPPSSA